MKYKNEKRAFITGAASGLGLALARQLAAEGWTLGLGDLRENPLENVSAQIASAGASNVLSFVFDVTDRKAYSAAAQEFLEQTGGIDLLINNAGVGDGGFFWDYKLEDWDWVMEINFMGVVNGCRLFLPAFLRQQGGIILNISSAAAFSNGPGMSAYNASKAAVRSLSETLRYELYGQGIQVSVAMPTFFKTNVMQFARGPKSARDFAARMIERSDQEAGPIAAEILQKTFRGKNEIVLPAKARRLFLIKKWIPAVFASRARKVIRKEASE